MLQSVTTPDISLDAVVQRIHSVQHSELYGNFIFEALWQTAEQKLSVLVCISPVTRC